MPQSVPPMTQNRMGNLKKIQKPGADYPVRRDVLHEKGGHHQHQHNEEADQAGCGRDTGQLAEYRRQKRRLGAEPPGGAEQEVQSVMEGIVGIDISAFDIGQ